MFPISYVELLQSVELSSWQKTKGTKRESRLAASASDLSVQVGILMRRNEKMDSKA